MKITLDKDKIYFILIKNLIASNLNEQKENIFNSIEKYPDVKSIVIDMDNVTEIDSLGINLLVTVYKELSTRNIELSLINTSIDIQDLLKMFKLNLYFKIS